MNMDKYYMEAAQMDRWLGLPVGTPPVTSAGFAAYLEEMYRQGSLSGAGTTREVALALLDSPGGQSFETAVFLGRQTTGLLPLQNRAASGFRFERKQEYLLSGVTVTVGTIRGITLRPFREWSVGKRARQDEGALVSG